MNKSESKLTRRKLLGFGLGAAGLAISKTALGAMQCGDLTPGQAEGPFYPINEQADKDSEIWNRLNRIFGLDHDPPYPS